MLIPSYTIKAAVAGLGQQVTYMHMQTRGLQFENHGLVYTVYHMCSLMHK